MKDVLAACLALALGNVLAQVIGAGNYDAAFERSFFQFFAVAIFYWWHKEKWVK